MSFCLAARLHLSPLLCISLALLIGCSSAADDATYAHTSAEDSAPLSQDSAPSPADDASKDSNIPDGLNAEDWDAIQGHIAKERYAFQRVEGLSAIALNPAQRLRGDFAEGRLDVVPVPASTDEVTSPTWSLGVSLSALGRAQNLQPIDTKDLLHDVIEHERLEFRRAGITEWYLNDERGIEQGFDIDARPKGDGELVVEVGFDTDLIPHRVSDDTVIFRSESGQNVLRYSGLVAWDSEGTDLPARMELAGTTVRLVVDDAKAVYPVTVDPWIQSEKVLASDGAVNHSFGRAVEVDGDVAIVGALRNDAVASNAGAAYIFARNQGGIGAWGEVAKLLPDSGHADQGFGVSVAIDGDVALVGAWGDNENGNGAGAAFVFLRNEGGPDAWGQSRKIVPETPAAGIRFGSSVALDQDVALIGSIQDNVNGTNSGSAFVFYRDEGGADLWGEVANIFPNDGAAEQAFGSSVAVHGDTALVGTTLSSVVNATGAAYVFYRNEGGTDGWGQVRKLVANDSTSAANFGSSLALHGDLAVIGAPGQNDSLDAVGAAYIHARNQGGSNGWGLVKKLNPDASFFNGFFGLSVAIENEVVVVGFPGSAAAGDRIGEAQVFLRNEGGTNAWGRAEKLFANDAAANDGFGFAVAIGGSTILSGAVGDDDLGFGSGSAYIFELPNVAPVAVDDAVATNEDASIDIDVLANDIDEDGDASALVIQDVSTPTNGTAVINGSNITYTPDPDFNGEDTFTYEVVDERGGTDSAEVVVTVVPVNDAPGLVETSAETDEDQPLTFTLNGNDPDGDTLSFSVGSEPENGTLVIEGDQATYTPDADFSGEDTFVVSVSDGQATEPVTFTITVNPVNDAPLAQDATAQTDESQPVTLTLEATDSNGDDLTFSVATEPQNGSVVIEDDQATYTPNEDFRGNDTFTFEVSDGDLTDTATVTITVSAANIAPIAANANAETDENQPVTLTLEATDVDGDDLTFSVATEPENGTVIIEGNRATYTPDEGFSGEDSFTFEVSDGESTDRATVTLEVIPVDDETTVTIEDSGCSSSGGAPSGGALILAMLGLMVLGRTRR